MVPALLSASLIAPAVIVAVPVAVPIYTMPGTLVVVCPAPVNFPSVSVPPVKSAPAPVVCPMARTEECTSALPESCPTVEAPNFASSTPPVKSTWLLK